MTDEALKPESPAVREMSAEDAAERLRDAGITWRRARGAERRAMQSIYAAVRDYVRAGGSQASAARIAGVDRMTVRKALGLR